MNIVKVCNHEWNKNNKKGKKFVHEKHKGKKGKTFEKHAIIIMTTKSVKTGKPLKKDRTERRKNYQLLCSLHIRSL